MSQTAWYENAVIYSIEVKSFMDSDGDGIGDFTGLTEKLDYLAGLGVTCVWLLPFYPTPNRDDGYDVSDYYDVDPRLGTLGDFAVFMREADQRGIRVIVDLVVNHTSDQHPWFQAARRDPGSRYRDYYVWTDAPPEVERRGRPVFPGEQRANWTYDAEAGAYYWHWFYDHQPDLNTGNLDVREEIEKIVEFWLRLGVSGFRVDAASFLIRRKGLSGTYPLDPGEFLRDLRSFVTTRRSDAVLLAEADVPAEDLALFLGEGDKMHLVFNFILNNHLFLALAREEADPLLRALSSVPICPAGSQWANFVRNHDELNLDKLSAAEQEAVFAAFAPEGSMRIYGRGIRRRMAPMVDGAQRRLEMVYSLLFSFPGVPVLRYGQEIGMGDDLTLAGRRSVRTPMQWSTGRNGGFSAAAGEKLVRPMIREGEYGYERVNVDEQRRDPESLLNFMLRLIRTRKECAELRYGTRTVLRTENPHVFAQRCEWRGGVVLVIHNLSREPCTISVPLEHEPAAHAAELLGDAEAVPLECATGPVHLSPYGYRWVRLSAAPDEAAAPAA